MTTPDSWISSEFSLLGRQHCPKVGCGRSLFSIKIDSRDLLHYQLATICWFCLFIIPVLMCLLPAQLVITSLTVKVNNVKWTLTVVMKYVLAQNVRKAHVWRTHVRKTQVSYMIIKISSIKDLSSLSSRIWVKLKYWGNILVLTNLGFN